MTKELVAIIPRSEPIAHITWQVTDWCNFRCGYCNEWNWGGKHKNEDFEPIRENLVKVLNYYKDNGYKYFKFFFSGGEPSIWKNLIPTCELIYQHCEFPGSCIGINTNLSKPLSWWEENHHYFNDVVASYHYEFTKYDKYIENYKFLSDRLWVSARLMMHKDYFKEMIEVGERIKVDSTNYRLEYTPVLDQLSPRSDFFSYDEQWQMDWFKGRGYEEKISKKVPWKMHHGGKFTQYSDGSKENFDQAFIINNKMNSFKGWRCHIQESLHINPDGNITMASCGVGKSVGNLLTGNIDFKVMDSVICPKTHCHCAADVDIVKHSPKHMAFK